MQHTGPPQTQTRPAHQCFFSSRNIGQVTPKIIYFHYLIKYFLDQSIQKIFYLILKKETLLHTSTVVGGSASFLAEISVRSPRKLFIFVI